MTHTFHIDTSSDKAKALLQYLRTLDFVREENELNDTVLTEKHMAILENRRNNRMSGKSKTYSWDDVKNSLGSNRKSS